MDVRRRCKIDLPQGQSAFLWGMRKSGKSSYLKKHFPDSLYIDLLNSDVYSELSKSPWHLREQVLSLESSELKYPIIIDEVQKVPALLDEVHWLIENTEAYFLLCGSSARKLKRGAANLLGGRAWGFHMYPLVTAELSDFDLLKAFNAGLLPQHYLSSNHKKFLKAYVQNYLKEEIQAEGLVRNLPSFSRFLDNFAFSNAELTNYSNIARDCGVDAKTVKEYYQILVDTLMGYYVYPYSHRDSRDLIKSTPKFYLADIGIANYLCQRSIKVLKGAEAGKSFEHLVLLELVAYRDYAEHEYEINFWRTKHGSEIDFVIKQGQELKLAIEVKISQSVSKSDLKSVVEFKKRFADCPVLVLSQDTRKRLIQTEYGDITIYPWKTFFQTLWAGELF